MVCHAMEIEEFLKQKPYAQEQYVVDETHFAQGSGSVEKQKVVQQKDDDFELVEKPILPQLNLALFDKEQSDQKSEKFGSGTLISFRKELIGKVFEKFSKVKDHGMRGLFRYVPNNIDASKAPHELLLIVHGTDGQETPGYYVPESEQFQHFLRNAGLFADEAGIVLDIYSYKWSGLLKPEKQVNAGAFLALMLNEMFHYYKGFHAWAHSHGLAPVLVAANSLVGERVFASCCAIGSPILEKNGLLFAPHVGELINFTSEDDSVQPLGYTWSTATGNTCDAWKMCGKTSPDQLSSDGKTIKKPCMGRVINVHYTHDDYSPGHSEFAGYVAKDLYSIVKAMKDFRFNAAALNVLANVVPGQKINAFLFPQTQQEQDYYSKELSKEMLALSQQNAKSHEEAYKSPKKLPFQLTYWDMLCAYGRKMRKMFK